MLDIVTGDRGEYRGDAAGAERLIDKLDSSPINCQGIMSNLMEILLKHKIIMEGEML